MKRVLRAKKKIRFVDLVRPEFANPYYSHIGPQEAFGVFQWMVKTAEARASKRNGAGYGLYDVLSANLRGRHFRLDDIPPFCADWRESLERRFHTVLLSGLVTNEVEMWKHDNGISITGSRVIPFLHYETGRGMVRVCCNENITEPLDKIFKFSGRTTKRSYNEYHPEARSVHRIVLAVEPERYCFDLVYGYPKDSSEWRDESASIESRAREPLLDFIERSCKFYDGLLLPQVPGQEQRAGIKLQ